MSRDAIGSRQPLGLKVAPSLPERGRLRLATPLGHRLGEIGEEHREPEPHRYPEDEPGGRLAVAHESLSEEERREDRSDVHDEHDRIPHLTPRRQLTERVDDRLHDDRGSKSARAFSVPAMFS